MKQLKAYTIIGIIFTIILGSLSHFFYEWSNNNFFVGLFAPINESTWEHMKLLFFPMLLYSMVMIPKLKENYPCIHPSYWTGILIGTLLIPVLFYTYTGILGYHIMTLDIGIFLLSVIIAFYSIYKLSLNCKAENCILLLFTLVCILAICFIVFTYSPPGIPLFSNPMESK